MDELFRLTNEYRVSQGLESLQKAPASTWEVADLRAQEITSSYSLTRLNGRKFDTAYTDLGYELPMWRAENINHNYFGDNVQHVFQVGFNIC